MSRRFANSLLARYDALVASGAIERDEAQIDVLKKLEEIARRLNREARRSATGLRVSFVERAKSFFSSREKSLVGPRGFYIWGAVGHGKTTLMDLFCDAIETPHKRRVHFHAFMIDVHEQLHRARRMASADPVLLVASEIANETRVLCFDEFSVTDIADATIVARLFTALLSAGVIVAATSNLQPTRLYEGGRNRELFLPFIALLQDRLEIIHLAARADYRLGRPEYGRVYFCPPDAAAEGAIDALFRQLTGQARGEPTTIEVKRRKVRAPQAAGRVARFDFRDICGIALGAADYLALARNFDTIIVERVPAMGADRRNEARRFIALVDVLYEARAKLVLSAEVEAECVFRGDQSNEAHEFKRTVSRLMEMRSEDYLQRSRMTLKEETSE